MEVIIDAKQHAAVIDSAYLASVRSYIDRKAVVGVLASHNKLKSKGGRRRRKHSRQVLLQLGGGKLNCLRGNCAAGNLHIRYTSVKKLPIDRTL